MEKHDIHVHVDVGGGSARADESKLVMAILMASVQGPQRSRELIKALGEHLEAHDDPRGFWILAGLQLEYPRRGGSSSVIEIKIGGTQDLPPAISFAGRRSGLSLEHPYGWKPPCPGVRVFDTLLPGCGLGVVIAVQLLPREHSKEETS